MAKITIDDIRQAGHCVRGTRDWFDQHGLDFKDMLKNGIEESEFLDTGDALAQQVVERKRARDG